MSLALNEVNLEEDLYQLWMFYSAKGDVNLFKDYLKSFLEQYKEFNDVEFTHLNGGFTAEGPHLTRLPEGLLQVVSKQLNLCSESCLTSVDPETLAYASQLTQCLIVVCRNLDNIALVASCEYVTHIVTIATIVLSKLSQENTENVTHLTTFINEALHFFECMYDPYFVWRKQLRGSKDKDAEDWWTLDRSRFKFRPALLHVEVVPFFYECFQHKTLDTEIQVRLFHVFGAVISGAQHNALRAICPATLDVLLEVLASSVTGSPPGGDQADLIMSLKDLVLKCIIRMVHVIHCCSPDQRQVEVGAVLEGYFQVLLKLSEDQPTEPNLHLQLKMLNSIHDMLICPDKSTLQVIFVAEGTFNSFVAYLQKTSLTGVEAQKFAMAIVRVMSSIMAGSGTAKEKFKEKVGYSKFVEALKSLGQPSKELLHTLLDLVVEGTFEGGVLYPIKNIQAALMLIQWLPDIQSHDLQLWLTESLCMVCSSDSHNRMHACNEGIVAAILNVLSRAHQVSSKAIGNLIQLLELLGTLSITASELKQLVGLLRPDKSQQVPYASRLVHAMSLMARKEGRVGALHYFDFQTPDAGIVVSGIRKWPGTGFSFHGWIRLDKYVTTPSFYFELSRRQLYSFTTATGSGFEAFFTSEDILIIAVCIKREYHTIAVTDHPIADQKWHCVDIIHTSSKRPFAQSQLSVLIDGKQKLSAQLKFPQLTEPFTVCRIGCGTKPSATVDKGPETIAPAESKSKFGGFKLPIPNPMRPSNTQSAAVVSLPAASLDSHFGNAECFQGQVGSVCIFHEPLQPVQVAALCSQGPNHLTVFQSDDGSIADLSQKLVLYYNAKACKNNMCLDLSFNQNQGRLNGHCCVTWDIKDVINCIGGIQVLFPLLENVGQTPEPPVDVSVNQENSPSPTDDLQNDWVVVKSSSYADAKLEQNQVAGFLALLRNMVQSNPTNQESLVRTNAIATLGALLQKVPTSYIDVHVLMAIQLLVEAICEVHKVLLYHIYQYLLFDFRIWSKSEFAVRIGHIQYLSTIIKEDRKHFRKKYGVQYLLDVIRTYYSDGDAQPLSLEDSRTIRVSLLGLVKYYVTKEITFDELNHLISFVTGVEGESMICDVLDLLLGLLEAPGKKDQIYLLMYEPNMAEVLYQNLANPNYSVRLKEKILRLFTLLLKTDKVYDKSKGRLRLHELGMFQGLASFMLGRPISLMMTKDMMDQVLATDSSAGYNAVVAILQLLQEGDIATRLEATRKIMSTLFSKTNSAKMLAKQIGWQQVLVKLFVLSPKSEVSLSTTTDSTDTVDHVPAGVSGCSDSGGDATNPSNSETPDDDLQSETPGDATDSASDFETPQFTNRSLFDDPSNSDYECLGIESSSRSSSTSAEDLTQSSGIQRRSNSLGVLHELTQEDAEKLLREPVTSKSVGDLAKTLAADVPDGKRLSSLASPSLAKRLNHRVRTESGSSDISLSSSQQDQDLFIALRKMGLSLRRDENMEQIEELTQNLLIIAFTILWKGVEGSDKVAWKLRGQVFATINAISQEYELLQPRVVLVRRLIEMMLQGCIMDLKETGQTNATFTENAMELIKMVYNFLCFEESEPPQEKFNERIIEDVMTLLDLMTVWEVGNEWREMEQLGLSILLAFAAQQDLDLCSIASARLHTLLQTRPVDKLQESCAVMAALDQILVRGLEEQSDHYNFLIPVMKALVDKCHDLLNMKTYCPNLPNPAQGPAFFDDFKVYCQDVEWRSFMDKQVVPSKEQYLANTFDEMKVTMKTYLGECHEDMMIDSHKRNRSRGESKLRFQAQISEAFLQKSRQESKRYQNVSTQLKNQHASALRQWRATRRFFTGERGAWSEKCEETMFWKLSNQENFSRMRPKLTQNYTHDQHAEASRQRDNIGTEGEPQHLLPPIEIAKEVMVVNEDIGDDRLGDEEWNVISAAVAPNEEYTGKEKLIRSENCELVTLMDVIKGRLEVTTTHIYFFDCSSNKDDGAGGDFKLSLAQLREIHFRRYNLRRSALEIFLIDQTNYFLNFEKKKSTPAVKIRNKVYSGILSLRPPNLIYYGSRSPAELLKASGLTQKWVQREISNFDYLMQLNTIAGRTYNDLSQYPVFPWILSDYTSETIDLENPKSYRDLSKPIGAVNPSNEKEVREKFDNFEDPSGMIEKFHYGTHYSNPAAIMHYLIRVEPFATLHIELQGNRFDVADRQFSSIPGTWNSLMENPNDVKELIPEFFYFPELLENLNGFDLGKMQVTCEEVDHVKLPTWATSPEDFIYKHRKALESEYVSQHLHEWIDLIFGYKQKGAAAAEALNVFYYCTYEGAVDLDAITDPLQRKALEGMINNFGQTPCQLLKEAHPKRLSFEEAVTKVTGNDRPLSVLWFLRQLKAFYVEATTDIDPLAFVTVPRNQARSFIQHGMPDAMIGITEEGTLCVHGWLPYDKSISNYFTFEKDPSMANTKQTKPRKAPPPLVPNDMRTPFSSMFSEALAMGKAVGLKMGSLLQPRTKKRLAGPFAPHLKVTAKMFAVSHDAKLVFTGGHWDNSLRVYSIAKGKTVAHIVRHTDIVTCLALDYCGSHVISGSRDTTCMIWEVLHQSGVSSGLSGKPAQILYGHDQEVTCVGISVELDMAVSGSKDGTVIIHTVRRGHYVRTLRPPCDWGCQLNINQLVLSDIGQIVLYCRQTNQAKSATEELLSLHLYSINGKHLSWERLGQPLSHMTITDGHLIMGCQSGLLVFKELFGLSTITTMPLHVPIQCLAVTNGNSHILVGLRDGKLIIVGIKKSPEVR